MRDISRFIHICGDKPVTNISELSTANGVVCFVWMMITTNGKRKSFRHPTKAYFGKNFSLFYYIKQVDKILPLFVQL